MTIVRPIVRNGVELLSPINEMVGGVLTAVTYRYLPLTEGAAYSGGADGVDGDLTAVTLELGERGTRTITWAMEGDLEGLALLGDSVAYAGLADESVQASSRDGWRSYIGSSVSGVGLAWQVSGEGCPESSWAMRIDFAARSVVIALGTLNRVGALEYIPDEVVVVFDAERARQYRPPHVGTSAWGEPAQVGEGP